MSSFVGVADNYIAPKSCSTCMLSEVVDKTIPIETISLLKKLVHNSKSNAGSILYIVVSGSDLYGFSSEDS
jgi:hypothetical protein